MPANDSHDHPLRVGIVGLGAFGKLHARTLVHLAEASLVALVGRSSKSLDEAAGIAPHATIWTDLTDAIAHSGAQAWIVASSTQSHVAITSQLLAAGFPVLLEKPLASTIEDAMRLAPLVKPDSSNLMLGHIVLFQTEVRQLLDEMTARSPLVFINAVRHRPLDHIDRFPHESPLEVTLVHDLYVTQALMQGMEPHRFQIAVQRDSGSRAVAVSANLSFPSGALATLTATWLTPPGMPADGFDRLEVFGADWAARIDGNPRPLTLWDRNAHHPLGLEIRTGANPTGMLAEELRCFCRVAQGRQATPVGTRFQDAIQLQLWMNKLAQCEKQE